MPHKILRASMPATHGLKRGSAPGVLRGLGRLKHALLLRRCGRDLGLCQLKDVGGIAALGAAERLAFVALLQIGPQLAWQWLAVEYTQALLEIGPSTSTGSTDSGFDFSGKGHFVESLLHVRQLTFRAFSAAPA